MASSIRVAIEVDNRKYIADINAADAATQKFAKSTEANLNKAGGNFDLLNKRIIGLKSMLAGLAFGAVGKSALQMADQLQDLSNSSGIAVGRLLELKKALTVAGGEADMMPQAINAFLRSVDDAANGTIKAQNEFMKLGVSLTDLRKLSETDLFMKTLEGIAALPTATERATAMNNNFGKSFKTVDPRELLAQLKETAGTSDRYAESIKRAAELNDQLATAQGNLKLAFLEAFSGPISQLVEFTNKTNEGTTKMQLLTDAIKGVGVAIAVAFSVSGALALVATIGQVGRALTVVAGVSKGMGGVFAAGGSFMVGLRGAAVAVAAIGTSIFAASQLFDDFGSVAENAMARVVEAIAKVIGSISGGVGGASIGAAIGSALGPIGTVIGGLVGGIGGSLAGDKLSELVGVKELAKNAEEARKKVEDLNAANRDRAKFPGQGRTDNYLKDTKKPETERQVDTTARAAALAGIKDITAEYEKQQRLNLQKLNLETQLVGKSEDEKQLREAQVQLANEYSNVQEQLLKKRASLGKEEQYLAGAINAEIKKNAEGFNAQFEALTQVITAQQTAKLLEEDRKRNIENMTKAMEQQQKIQEALSGAKLTIIGQQQDVKFQGSMIGKGGLEKQFADITEANRKAGLEASRAFAAAFEDGGDGLTPERAKQLQDGLDKIAAGYKSITDEQIANLNLSRAWDTGWSEAFANYKDSASNAAEQSKTYFETFTRGVEDAIVTFVKTGKLSFKDLANSLIAEFARIQAKQLLSSLMPSTGGGGAGGLMSGLWAGVKSIFGFASGGNPPVGKASIVGERGPELFVPRNAGTIIPNDKIGGGGSTSVVTYNIQATDAASFQQMLARDPTFIHAIAEKGRRSMPQGVIR